MSITRLVLATITVFGSATLAQAQGFDPNLANRYPGYAEPGVYGYTANGGSPVRLNAESLHGRSVLLPRQSRPR